MPGPVVEVARPWRTQAAIVSLHADDQRDWPQIGALSRHTDSPGGLAGGRMREARAAYNHALALAHRDAERRLLERKRSEFTAA